MWSFNGALCFAYQSLYPFQHALLNIQQLSMPKLSLQLDFQCTAGPAKAPMRHKAEDCLNWSLRNTPAPPRRSPALLDLLLHLKSSCPSNPVATSLSASSEIDWYHFICSSVMSFTISSEQQITDFILRHRDLLRKERDAEIERTSLLLTNCAPSLLEQKGLALGSLGVANVSIGLGGKTCVSRCMQSGALLTC